MYAFSRCFLWVSGIHEDLMLNCVFSDSNVKKKNNRKEFTDSSSVGQLFKKNLRVRENVCL